jgi:hypothetical protein
MFIQSGEGLCTLQQPSMQQQLGDLNALPPHLLESDFMLLCSGLTETHNNDPDAAIEGIMVMRVAN